MSFAKHLTILNTRRTTFAPGRYMVGIHFGYHVNLGANIIMAVRISRRITGQQLQVEAARYIDAAHNGAVLISPAISPGEKEVMRQAFNQHLPIVVVARNGFTPLSKPKGEQFDACADGRLLILSAWEHSNERLPLTASDCQQMNLMALELAGE